MADDQCPTCGRPWPGDGEVFTESVAAATAALELPPADELARRIGTVRVSIEAYWSKPQKRRRWWHRRGRK